MKESINSRVYRLISGTANALIDAVENSVPEVIIQQSFREIDEAIDDIRADLGKVLANKHIANKRLMEESEKHEKLIENIEFAVKNNRDDLAEAAISRQMDIEAQIPIIESNISNLSLNKKELEGYLTALLARKREMEEEFSKYKEVAQYQYVNQEEKLSNNSYDSEKTLLAEKAFNRIMNKKGNIAGLGLNNDSVKLAELEELSRSHRIKERLEQIKSQTQ